MKRVSLSTLLCCLITFSAQHMYAQPQEATQAVYKQQQGFVSGLIKHCKERLPLVVDAHVSYKSTILALDELGFFLSLHPDALECVIDTFQTCIDEACMDVPARVSACIQNYEAAEKRVSLPHTLVLQEKINNLVLSYFKFQLTMLGALDYYGQQFLQKTQLMTYIELAKPWILFFGIYALIHGSVKALEYLLQSNPAAHSNLKNRISNSANYFGSETAVSPITPHENAVSIAIANLQNFLERTLPKPGKPCAEPTVGNTLKALAGGVLKELDSSILTKAIAAGLFIPDIRANVDKINKYTQENFAQKYAELIGKARKSGYSAKPSKESFDTLKGYEDTKLLMMPVMDFCTNLNEYRAADLKIARGYLFEGPLADGRKMAFALAGEMTKKLKSLGSPAQWLTYEIHGSSLVNKKLDKVLEECLEFGPTVLIITNIDWIYKQKDVEPEVYADIINRLTRYLSTESNFPLLICATSQDHTIIDPVLLEYNKFELVPLV